MKNSEKIKELIETDPDFIAIKRYGYSLERLEKRFPEGCENRIIANALQITEEEVDDLYNKSILTIREKLKINV